MTKLGTPFALALTLSVSAAAQPTVGWPETIDRLQEQRSQAEACVALLRDSGDVAAIRKSRIAYGAAKAASDGVIAGFTIGLVERYKPERLLPLQANLERAGKGLKEVCDAAVASGSAADATRGIVGDVAKAAVEPIVAALKEGASALWARHLKEDKVEIETIKGQSRPQNGPTLGRNRISEEYDLSAWPPSPSGPTHGPTPP
jgi:hypothetical protein